MMVLVTGCLVGLLMTLQCLADAPSPAPAAPSRLVVECDQEGGAQHRLLHPGELQGNEFCHQVQ